ncbi:MAG: restriction endonuclease subunit S [Myxococcales bacterium]|nr:restriction endonuclease subunit S [Myxococcales bacterium]
MSKWPVVALGEVFSIARGGSPRPIDDFITDDPKGVNWIMIGDAVEGSKHIAATKKRIRREGVSRSREVKPGDFLLTNSMSFGHPYILATAGCIHDGWLVLSPRNKNVHQDYFYHLLGSPIVYAAFKRLAAGAVVKNLNSELVRGVEVPLPPVEEQRRIADILDKADAVRRKRREAIALTEELLRSAFLEMFGDPVTNPRGWELEPLTSFGKVTTGNTPPRERLEYYGDYLEWIKSDNINTPSHALTTATEGLSELGARVARTAPRGSTLMTCIAGSPSCIGNVGLADRTVAFNQQINAVVPNEETDHRFLYALLLVGKGLVRAASTNSMKGMVSKGKLESVMFPRPPHPAQLRFGEMFDRILALSRRLNLATDEQEVLFNSLVHRAFRGDLSGSRSRPDGSKAEDSAP